MIKCSNKIVISLFQLKPKAKKNVESKKDDRNKIDDFVEYIGIDPGVRKTISIVKRSYDIDQKVSEEHSSMRAREYYFDTNYFKIKKRQSKMTEDFDKLERKLMDSSAYKNNKPSSKSIDFRNFIDFKLKLFKRGTEAYMKKGITALRLERYRYTQKHIDKMCKKVRWFHFLIVIFGNA